MADSGALRVHRAKLHKAGDHSICTSRCPAVTARQPPGAVEAAVSAFLSPLQFDGDDPRGVMCAVAIRLGQLMDVGRPPPRVVLDLEHVLGQISEFPADSPDALDDVRSQMWTRKLNALMGALHERPGHG